MARDTLDTRNRMRYDCSECGETWFVQHDRILRSLADAQRQSINIGICPNDNTLLDLSEGWKRPNETRRTVKRKADASQALYVLVMNIAEAASHGRMPTEDFTRNMTEDVVERLTDLADSVARELAR